VLIKYGKPVFSLEMNRIDYPSTLLHIKSEGRHHFGSFSQDSSRGIGSQCSIWLRL
jgi:hypothetical protein